MNPRKLLIGMVFTFWSLASPNNTWAAINFVISNPQINGEEITVDASISGSSTIYYLQGKFAVPGNSDYFGWTQNNHGDFVRYTSSPDPNFVTTNFFKTSPTGSVWSGQLKVKNDHESVRYEGPGEYNLKIERYTGQSNSGSAAGESNTILVNLNFELPTPTSMPTNTPTPTSTPTPKPTATLTPKTTPKPSATPVATPEPSMSAESTESSQTNEEATDEETTNVLGEKDTLKDEETSEKTTKNNDFVLPLVIAGLGIILIGAAGVTYYRQKIKPATK